MTTPSRTRGHVFETRDAPEARLSRGARPSACITRAHRRPSSSDEAAALRDFLEERTHKALVPSPDDERVLRICDAPVFIGDGIIGYQPGFVRTLNAWCREVGIPPIDVREHLDWLEAELGMTLVNDWRVAISGVRLRNFPGGGRIMRLPWRFYSEHFTTVFLHFICLLLPALLVCATALKLQVRYSKLWANTMADEKTEVAWSVYDPQLVEHFVFNADDFLPHVEVVAIFSGLYLLLAFLRMYCHYLGQGAYGAPPVPKAVQRWISLVFGILCFGMFVFTCFVLALTVVWLIGAMVLDPHRMLAQSCAFMSLVTTAAALYKELRAAALTHERRVADVVQERLSLALQEWVKTSDASIVAADVSAASRAHLALIDADIEAAKGIAKDLSDVQIMHAILDADQSGGVTRRELQALVGIMDIDGFDENRIDQVFAYANVDLDDHISIDEFEQAWAWVETEIVAMTMENAGLSRRFINAAVAGAVLLLCGIFWFIFTVVSAWSNNDSFAAVIETLLVISASIAVKFMSPSAQAFLPQSVVRRGRDYANAGKKRI